MTKKIVVVKDKDYGNYTVEFLSWSYNHNDIINLYGNHIRFKVYYPWWKKLFKKNPILIEL